MANRGQARGGRGQRGNPRGGFRGGGVGGRASPSSAPSSPQQTHGETRGGMRGVGGQRGGPPRGRGRGGPPQVFAPGTPATLEPRLSTQEQASLIKSLQALSVIDNKPVRPGFGTVGTPITLRANFFAVKYPKNVILHDYKVDITPKTDINRLKKRIFELLEGTPELASYLHDIAHDRSQRIVSRRKFPDPFIINVPFYEDGEGGPRTGAKVYKAEITYDCELKTADLDRYLEGKDPTYNTNPIISAFNLITKAHASKTGVMSGKDRYFFPPETYPLSLGLEAWKGYYASVRPAFKQLLVNVNVAMSAFYVPTSSMADAIKAFQRESHGGMPSMNAFFGKRVRVTTTHLGYRQKKPVKAIDDRPASKIVFDCEELGGRVTVAQYFERKYKIKLRYANDLPVINIGTAKRDNYVPAELCELEAGQPFRGLLDDRATAEMIKYACNPPADNANAIVFDGLPKLGFANPQTPMPGFGFSVSAEMVVVPARILPAPTVSYKSGKPNVRDGSWNILDVQFTVPARLSDIAILVVVDGPRSPFKETSDPALRRVVEGFIEKCRKSGMAVDTGLPPLRMTPSLPLQSTQDPFRRRAIDEVAKVVRTLPKRPRLVLIFLPGIEKHIYPGLKRLFDVTLGIHSVCMLSEKALKDKGQDQYFSNNALKVNAKLGGVGHILGAESTRSLKGVMLVGMDVTHAGPGTVKGTASIAVMVASCDERFAEYPASARIQKPKETKESEEMIQDTTAMMIERLTEYRKRNKTQLPERVIVYRDGVSEGQFQTVREFELPRIRAAFQSFKEYSQKPPKLTIVICGKRHNARFYPTDQAKMDRTGNTPAGTVVDRGVTAVYEFNFYLQAHAGLQGTTRPTHYTVVHDENHYNADTMQGLTHNLSYLWARATKSVSLVPPAYWADQACERVRWYLHEILPPLPGSPDSKLDRDGIWRRSQELWGNGVHENLRSSMFYL